jgi:hypothetical protein
MIGIPTSLAVESEIDRLLSNIARSARQCRGSGS